MKKLFLGLSVCALVFWACSDDSSSSTNVADGGDTVLSSEADAALSFEEAPALSSADEPAPESSATVPAPDSSATVDPESSAAVASEPVSSATANPESSATVGPEPESSAVVEESSVSVAIAMAKTNEYGMALGECTNDDPYAALAKSPSYLSAPEDPSTAQVAAREAYILTDGNGKYQVFLPRVSDYCQVEAKISMERDGDTLKIGYVFGEGAMMTKCLCVTDHWFDIDAAYADVKFVTFSGIEFAVVAK